MAEEQTVDGETEHLTEETPLLQKRDLKEVPVPFPWFQFSILMLCLMVETVASSSISPYINKRVSELGVTGGDDRKIGYYVGLLQSMYHFSEAIAIFHWGRLSDRIGRRPVLIMGLSGILTSMILFGLAQSYLTLVLSRCLYGLLNGNIVIMKSLICEISDSSPENMVRAFALQPLVWAVGATIGPAIGGQLANPSERFPDIFGGVQFWEDYPYLLPCLVAAGFSMLVFVAVAQFLKETVVVGRNSEEARRTPQRPMREMLTPTVTAVVLSYGCFALIEIAYSGLQPLFYYTKVDFGGLGLSVPDIGHVLGLRSIWYGTVTAICFSEVHKRLGTRQVFVLGMATFIPMLVLYPVMNLSARLYGMGPITISALLLQLSLYPLVEMSYSCIFMFINAAAPDKKSLGETNGIAQLVVSVVRAVTPLAAASLFAVTIEKQLLGGMLVYVVLILICFVSLPLSFLLPRSAISRAP